MVVSLVVLWEGWTTEIRQSCNQQHPANHRTNAISKAVGKQNNHLLSQLKPLVFSTVYQCHLLPTHAGPDLLGVLGRTNFEAPRKHLSVNVAGNPWGPFQDFSGETLGDPNSMLNSKPLVTERSRYVRRSILIITEGAEENLFWSSLAKIHGDD